MAASSDGTTVTTAQDKDGNTFAVRAVEGDSYALAYPVSDNGDGTVSLGAPVQRSMSDFDKGSMASAPLETYLQGLSARQRAQGQSEDAAARQQDMAASLPPIRADRPMQAVRPVTYFTTDMKKEKAAVEGSRIEAVADVPEGTAADTPVRVVVTAPNGKAEPGVMTYGQLQGMLADGTAMESEPVRRDPEHRVSVSGAAQGQQPLQDAQPSPQGTGESVAQAGTGTVSGQQPGEVNRPAQAQPAVQGQGGMAAIPDGSTAMPQGQAQPGGVSQGGEAAVPAAQAVQATAQPNVREDGMPLDEEGSPMYEQAPVQATWDDLMARNGRDEGKVRYFVQEMKAVKDRELKAERKKKPKGKNAAELQRAMDEQQAKIERLEQESSYWDTVLSMSYRAGEAATTEGARARQAEAGRKREASERGFPAIQARWGSARKEEGMEDELMLPDGSVVVGRYYLVEAEAPTASHDPSNGFRPSEGFPVDGNGRTVNDRDYEHDRQAQENVLGKASDYDQRAMQNPVVVSRDGVVLSGNDRTMASQIAARQGTDGKYVDYLRRHPGKYGFEAGQVSGYAHPRVVFVPDGEMGYDAATFARFNRTDMKTQDRTESAVKMGKTVPEEVFSRIASLVNRHESIGEAYRDESTTRELVAELVSSGVLEKERVSELVDGGRLSGAGEDYVESLLVGGVLEEDALRAAMEDRQLRRAVVSAILPLVENRALKNGYSLASEISDAVKLVRDAKASRAVRFGESVSMYVRQNDLFGEDVVAEATVQLLGDVINSGNAGQLKKVLNEYNEEALNASQGQADLFAGDVLEKDVILRNVLKHYGYETRTTDTSARAAARTQRGRQEEGNPEGQAGPPVQGRAEDGDAAARTGQGGLTSGEAVRPSGKEQGGTASGNERIEGENRNVTGTEDRSLEGGTPEGRKARLEERHRQRQEAETEARERLAGLGAQGNGEPDFHRSGERGAEAPTEAEAELRDAIVGRLRESGIEVVEDSEAGQRVLDEVNGRRENRKRKSTNDTALPEEESSFKGTVIPFVDTANIRKNLESLASNYERTDNTSNKNVISELGKAIGAEQKGSSSQYVTIEAKNGNQVTIRLSDHNASVERMDNAGKDNAISIVISRKGNKGIQGTGEARIVEYYYSDKKLRQAGGKAVAAIARSLQQTLYSGEFKDTTGLADVDVKNADRIREHRVYHGSGADFDAFDHSHMGEGEGAQAYGWGSYVTEVKGIGRTYAEERRKTPDDIEDIVESKMEEWDSDQDNAIDIDDRTREHFGINEPIHLWDKYEIGDADETELAKEAAAYYDREIDLNNDEDIESIIDELLGDMDDYYQYEYSQRRDEYEQQVREQLSTSVYLYTLEIPDDNGGNYLHWEKPVPDGIDREKLWDFTLGAVLSKGAHDETEREMLSNDIRESIEDAKTGKDLYKAISLYIGEKEASLLLSDMGFTGISYPAEYLSGGRSDGARNFVIFKESDMKITGKVKFFRTPQGEAYGFTVGGKIYLDPRIAKADTPIHEYAHLWASALREGKPEEWANVAGLMKDTPVWEEVKRLYPELETDEEIADEVLATYSGRRGAERLREAMREAGKEDGLGGRLAAMEAVGRVREALQRFWHAVADLLHIRYATAEEVADRVLKDLLDGVNPGATGRKLRLQSKDEALFSGLTPEARAEMETIKAKAEADGTYMKAPNGKPTNLSERQWLQVRTKAFKEWFGDWELAEKLRMIGSVTPVSVDDYQHIDQKEAEAIFEKLENGKNVHDGREVQWVKSIVGKILRHKGFDTSRLIPAIKDVFDNSVPIASEAEIKREGHKEHPNFKGYHHYVGKIQADGKDYYVRFTVQEINTRRKGIVANQLHSTFISDVEITSADTRVNTGNTPATANTSTFVDAKLQQFLEEARAAASNSSKVVDENGEPLVVYHGTPLRRDQITPNRGWQKDGTYVRQEAPFHTFKGGEYSGMIFTSAEAVKARSIAEKRALSIPDNADGTEQWTEEGYVYDLFVNVKNPFVPQRDAEGILSSMGENIPTLNFYGGEGESVPVDVAKEILESGNSWIVTETPQFIEKVRESGYDGLYGKDEGVDYIACFAPNQLKDAYENTGTFSAMNDDIRFSLRKPVEEKGNLIALHNLSADNLKKAFELGGFPMPSIAVTNTEVGHTGFGDISLVFGKESIDPTDRRNKVYSEDAWTPMFPKVDYKLDEGKANEIYSKAKKAGELPFLKPVSFHPENLKDRIGMDGTKSLVDHFKESYAAKQLYLSGQGKAVDGYEHHEVEKYLPDQINLFEAMLEGIGLEKLKGERNDALEEEVKRLIGEQYGIDFSAIKPFRAKIRVENAIGRAIDYAENGNKKTEADIEATEKKIDERIDPGKFEAWLEDLFGGIVEKKGIRNDKDMFTPSGNRRKWESLYDAITLDNVVKSMKKQEARGGHGIFGGSIFGAAQKEYRTINEIREAARERIRALSGEEIESMRNGIVDRLSKITIPSAKEGVVESFDMVANIMDAVRLSHKAEGIYRYLRGYYPGMTMDVAEEIAGIVSDIQKMSARFFEAKPRRAVGFEEVRVAVVPDNAEKAVVEGLEERGVPVREYKAGNEESRKEAVNRAAEEFGILFRQQGGHGDATDMESKRAAVEALGRKLNVEVVFEDEASLRKQPRQYRTASGWFDRAQWRKDGRRVIHVNLSNTGDAHEAEMTVLHEAVGHMGLRELLGAENYDPFLDMVHGIIPEAQAGRLRALVFKGHPDLARRVGEGNADGKDREAAETELRRVMADEWLAELAEVGGEPGVWEQIVESFRMLLRRLGFELSLSESDIRALLFESRRNLESSRLPGEAERIREQQRDFREAARLDRIMEADMADMEADAGSEGVLFRQGGGASARPTRSQRRQAERMFRDDKIISAGKEREWTSRQRFRHGMANLQEFFNDSVRLRYLGNHIRRMGGRVSSATDLYELATTVPAKEQYRSERFELSCGRPLVSCVREIFLTSSL